ncbi:MAG: GspH/FimT family pseudopilin [Nevskiaceae bacterium]|jgi:type IV fimbrial biogenesis protein FimT|nr:GspH/FimT family pseudopilin [Nevskiaceae bacterium]
MSRLAHNRVARGFTLMELVTTIAIAAILVAIAAPDMSLFVKNGRIRAAAESLQNGLTLARAEAVRRNRNVVFIRDATGWSVIDESSETLLHQGSGKEGATGLTIAADPADADRITYDSFGRATKNAGGSAPLAMINIESASPSENVNYRPLRIEILGTGASRLCQPSVESTDPRACVL